MATKKKVKAQAASRPISPKELKFWLEGILEFQDDNWIPNKEQWKSIQDKIFNLEDTPDNSLNRAYITKSTAPVIPSTMQENVFQPTGGAAGLPASTFPEDIELGSSLEVPTVPPVMPIRDANGFYKMPENLGISEKPVVASGGKKHQLKTSFE